MQNITAADGADRQRAPSSRHAGVDRDAADAYSGLWSSSAESLCFRYWNWKKRAAVTAALRRCGCRSRSGRSYSFRSCPVLQGSFLRHAAWALTSSAVICCHFTCIQVGFLPLQPQAVHVTFVRRLSFWVALPCSSDTRLLDRLTATGWIKRETLEIR